MRSLRLALVLVCASCAYSADGYQKPGGSADQKSVDREYCEAYASGHGDGMTSGGIAGMAAYGAQREGLFKQCMMDRGYRPT